MNEKSPSTSSPTCSRCGKPVPGRRGSQSLCPLCLAEAARVAFGPALGVAESWNRLTETFPHLDFGDQETLGADAGPAVLGATTYSDRSPVAVQLLSAACMAAGTHSEDLLARVTRLAAIQHPNLARVLDFGELDDGFYLITEAPEPSEASEDQEFGGVDWVAPVADALNSAHSLGVEIRFDPAWAWMDAHHRPCFVPLLEETADKAGASDDRDQRFDAEVDASRVLEAGTQIGAFRVIDKLGEGGFSEVWLAEQTEPVRRKVALKFLKVGMDTRRLLARFEAEQQALARLDHANIARVFDAGATEWGRPFFVMEPVDGKRLTDYCDQEALRVADRLRLFLRICRATHHAHQKGIIHRDLKPANIMVTRDADGGAVPKIIDFGIAKAVSEPLTDQTIYTREDQLLGTLEYMSPEQATRGSEEVDTSTDVYALGAILYELLVGSPPFSRSGQSEESVRRQVLEEVPSRPSRFAEESDRQLARRLRGDLDWIVMRCLEKEPGRRYASAAGLARDLERHLANEPVEAGPPALGYRMKKFVRRHTSAVAAACIAVSAVFGGLLMALQGYQEAKANEKSARDAETLAGERLSESEKARQEAEAIVAFTLKLLGNDSTHDTITTFDDLLARGIELLDPGSFPYPEHRVTLLSQFARIYGNRGRADIAIPLHEEILEYHSEALGDSHGKTLGAMGSLAHFYYDAGRNREALALRRQVLQGVRRADPPLPTIRLRTALTELADSLYSEGQFERGLAMHEAAFELAEAEYAESERPLPYGPQEIMVRALKNAGRLDQAIKLAEGLVQWTKTELGPDDPKYLHAVGNLADVLVAAGRNQDALRHYEELLHVWEKKAGPSHAKTLRSRSFVATTLARLAFVDESRAQDAIDSFDTVLRLCNKHLGPEHATTLHTAVNTCATLNRFERFDECLKIARNYLPVFRRTHGITDRGRIAVESLFLTSALECGHATEAYEAWLTLLDELTEEGYDRSSRSARLVFLIQESSGRRGSANRPSRDLVALSTLAGKSGLEQNQMERARDLFLLSFIADLCSDPSLAVMDEPRAALQHFVDTMTSASGLASLTPAIDPDIATKPNVSAAILPLLETFDPTPLIDAMQERTSFGIRSLPAGWKQFAKAQLVAMDGRWEEALAVTEIILPTVDAGTEFARILARFRWHCLNELGRGDAAFAELKFGVPPRPAEAQPSHLDLSQHYTGFLDERFMLGDVEEKDTVLPREFMGMLHAGPPGEPEKLTFDVRGMLTLAGGVHESKDYVVRYPQEVRGIRVGRPVDGLYFLHATNSDRERDADYAAYVVNYADGTRRVIHLDYNGSALNMTRLVWDRFPGSHCDQGYVVHAPFFIGYESSANLWVLPWINPQPDVPVESIDVRSHGKETALMLFGVTTMAPEESVDLPSELMAATLLKSGFDLRGAKAQAAFEEWGKELPESGDAADLRRAGVVLAMGADRARYERYCRDLIKKTSDDDGPDVLRSGAWILLLPQASEYEELVTAGIEMLRKAEDLKPEHPEVPVERALVAYRLGQYAEAAKLLEKVPPTENWDQTTRALLLRAMTAAQLGERARAARYLDEVRPGIQERAENLARGVFDEQWAMILMNQLLLKEVEVLREHGR